MSKASPTVNSPLRIVLKTVGLDTGMEDELPKHANLLHSKIGDRQKFTDLRQLATTMKKTSTPLRQASSLGPSSTRKAQARVILDASTMKPATRRGSLTTPHAIRALQKRRAATTFSPGRDWRRSGRQQRESPRNTLRNLSWVLSKTDKPNYSPQEPVRNSVNDAEVEEGEAEVEMPVPRLSLPIDDDTDNEDSFDLPAPRLSLVTSDGDMYTQRSVEVLRRAVSEQPLGQQNSASIRMGDHFRPDLTRDSSSFGALDQTWLSLESGANVGGYDQFNEGDHTENLQQQMFERHDRRKNHTEKTRSQHSPTDSDDATFALDIPLNLDTGFRISEPVLQELDEDNQYMTRIVPQSANVIAPNKALGSRKSKPAVRKTSRHSATRQSLPINVTKKIASSLARSCDSSKAKITKEAASAISQASDWFFEQLGDDLGAFARHARKKTIDESDVITLMRRQRQLTAMTTPFSLAQKYLPREMLQAIRIVPPAVVDNESNVDPS